MSEDQLGQRYRSAPRAPLVALVGCCIAYSPLADREADARAEIAKVLQALTQRGVSQDMLAAAHRYVERQWVQQRKNVSDLADYYAHWEIATRAPDFGAEVQRGTGSN